MLLLAKTLELAIEKSDAIFCSTPFFSSSLFFVWSLFSSIPEMLHSKYVDSSVECGLEIEGL